ncbi:MAG: SWIM zinc finger family protein [Cyanobacterium sp. T60_A2020_053]|nr:SWIM zinc finger family protein [Cyanobacterium sp. T60_A2020_053]
MINRQWWVEKWLELLDSYRYKKRLERARNYAREGNVLNLEFRQNHLVAEVQGSEDKPYRVTLSLDTFSDEDWGYVINTMSQKAILAAQLLVGEMPSEIEQVFIKNGLSLFPFNLTDVKSRCTCADKVNPCKHIGAVYYQLADRFSEDPFIIFQLRGRSKEQILEALRICRTIKLSGEKLEPEMLGKIKSLPKKKPKQNKISVPLNIDNFWEYNEPLDASLVVITPPTDKKNILEVLGSIPLPYNDSEEVMEYLKQVYNSVPLKVMQITLTNN